MPGSRYPQSSRTRLHNGRVHERAHERQTPPNRSPALMRLAHGRLQPGPKLGRHGVPAQGQLQSLRHRTLAGGQHRRGGGERIAHEIGAHCSPEYPQCLWTMSLDHRSRARSLCSFSSARHGNMCSMCWHSSRPCFTLRVPQHRCPSLVPWNPCAPWSWTPPRPASMHFWSVVAALGSRASTRCGPVFCT